jgi:hypothetical protein
MQDEVVITLRVMVFKVVITLRVMVFKVVITLRVMKRASRGA